MQEEQHLSFDLYRLDPPNACVWRGKQAIALTPKAFTVLRYLVAHAGRLVTKDELFQAAWPDIAVSDAALAICIGEIRKALGDAAQAPRFIATVHRRGYRFIAPVSPAMPATSMVAPAAAPAPLPAAPPPRLMGREAEFTRLHGWLEEARRGARQVVFVTGETGIGKTAVVEAFVAELANEARLWVAQGQCLQHYGAGEAYLPVLAALGQLGRTPGHGPLLEVLGQYAPTWLAQLPALLSPAALEAVQRRVLGASRDRMLRELAEAVEALTVERVLVLVLEDLHWSDYATLDLLSWLARRREPARLLLLGTYRPVEVIVHGHPLHAVKQDLHLHRQCAELALEALSEAAVAAYLEARWAGRQVPAGLARLLHQRTDGHPLFLVTLVEALVQQGLVGGSAAAVAEVVGRVPESLRQMIEQQFDGLQPEDQRMLEAASVAGVEFAVAAVAAATETTQAWVEDRCAGLERRAQWLQARGVEEWPDGTVAARYAFRHALYQQVLYDRLPVGRRVQLHRQLGAREAAGYGERAWEKAAELAVHFDRGRDAAQAVPYLRQAAANALGRYAYVEAIAHCTRGLALLQTLPDTPERAQHELALQTTLGSALVATKGFTSAEVEQAYRRARELCGQVGETAHLFPVLWGLWLFYSGRSQLQAYALVEHLVRVAHQTQEPTLLLQAYHAQWGTLFALGELELTRTCLQQGSALYSAQRHSWGTWPFAGHDPGVCCYGYTGLMLWLLGYPSQAVEQVREMLHLATQLAHPLSLASAYTNASYLALLRRDRQALQEQMEAQTAVTSEHDFTYHLTARVIVQSWTALEQAPTAEGIARLQQSLASYRDAGTAEWYPYFLTLLAEAHRQTGQTEAGLAVLAEALALVDRSAERWCEAELYRLKGELLLALSAEKQPESETCLHQALAIARRQQAKAWELRAAMSLARLWQRQGKGGEAQQLLAEVYGWFTEGFDTADLQEAQALLEELA